VGDYGGLLLLLSGVFGFFMLDVFVFVVTKTESNSQLSNMIGHACTSRGYFSSDIGQDSVAEIL